MVNGLISLDLLVNYPIGQGVKQGDSGSLAASSWGCLKLKQLDIVAV
jgi:hypothetical protein